MKKYFIFAALAAVALAACAKIETNEVVGNIDEPVAFGVYAGNSATKAVSATDFGTVTTSTLQAAASNGFGVFAYHHDASAGQTEYSSTASMPNFMYNQKVTYSTDKWTYNPVKYWPNEHGTSAVSTNVDKLSFLTYAPWVENLDAANGTVKDKDDSAASEGIIAMTGNATAGDAILTFKVPASSKEQIDLLYGVLNAKSVNVDGTSEGTEGEAILNLTKEKTGGKVDIKFKHALSKIAINIKDVVDKADDESNVNPASDNTKVVVKELKLLGENISKDGKLNLRTGAWSDFTVATDFTVTPLPDAIYSGATDPTAYPTVDGVKEAGLTKTIDIMLVPATDASATNISKITGVEITYYVITKDAQLNGGVSVVENHITKSLESANQITLNKGTQYGLNVLLGLTSVKLTATVEDWTPSTVTPTEIDLPRNVE